MMRSPQRNDAVTALVLALVRVISEQRLHANGGGFRLGRSDAMA